jgi:uncharacterized peroxidase-related enzyme
MPRLSKLTPSEVNAEVREEFDYYLKERGNVPNMFRTMAHRPDIMRTMTSHFRAVMNTGTVEKKLKEMIVVRVSFINHCDYCLNSHTALAGRLGVTGEEIAALEKGELGGFGERERLALEFADKLTTDSHSVTDELFARLRGHFNEGEIVEIAAVAGVFNYFNRVNNALQMEPTR